ncbi:S1 RNA-binding domain-containing protein [Streptomyces sp. NPDC087300]|uniref:S1 RNA-binding domain-containing protein n=1 Tax=Streptomyces sp. NPDC087300 TaxID=3365780 RepID=UPI0038257AE6
MALTSFLNALRAGEVRTGRVISLEGREALVELDGFSGPGRAVGRIPRGDLTRKVIGHASEAASIGQHIAFEVISVDRRQEWAGPAVAEGPPGEPARSLRGPSRASHHRPSHQADPVRIVEVDLPRHRLTLSARNLPQDGKQRSS